MSIDDYYKLFKTEKGDHVLRYVLRCLRFDLSPDASENEKKIAENMKATLKKMLRKVLSTDCVLKRCVTSQRPTFGFELSNAR